MSKQVRIRRWEQLYSAKPSKKMIHFIIYYPRVPSDPPKRRKETVSERIERAKRTYEWQMHNMNCYDDDAIPCIKPGGGTSTFAECFGCQVVYPENSPPFALPLVSDSRAASMLRTPKLEDTHLMDIFAINDEMRRFAGDTALIQLPDIQCPMDVAALIWDKNDLFPTMIDAPDAVLELAHKVMELQTAFLDEWFRRYGAQFIAHYPNYYMEKGITMSVDEIGSVSPAMFQEFFAGEINALSRRYGGVGIHCCANSAKQWEHLRQIEGLKMINLHRDRPEVFRAFDFFKDTCVQMHRPLDWQNILPEELEKALPERCRVVLPLEARDLEHAKELAEIYAKYRY